MQRGRLAAHLQPQRAALPALVAPPAVAQLHQHLRGVTWDEDPAEGPTDGQSETETGRWIQSLPLKADESPPPPPPPPPKRLESGTSTLWRRWPPKALPRVSGAQVRGRGHLSRMSGGGESRMFFPSKGSMRPAMSAGRNWRPKPLDAGGSHHSGNPSVASLLLPGSLDLQGGALSPLPPPPTGLHILHHYPFCRHRRPFPPAWNSLA